MFNLGPFHIILIRHFAFPNLLRETHKNADVPVFNLYNDNPTAISRLYLDYIHI